MRPAPNVRMSGGIGAAMEETRRAHAQAQSATGSRTSLHRLISWTDAMIEELELENLRGNHRPSAAWSPRLALLFSSLPFDVGRPIHPPRSHAELLDLVYDVQEGLF